MKHKRIIAKIIIVIILFGGYGTFDQVTSVASILGLAQIEKEASVEIEVWVYELVYLAWLYDYLLVLGLLIAVFFRYELVEPFKKLRKGL